MTSTSSQRMQQCSCCVNKTVFFLQPGTQIEFIEMNFHYQQLQHKICLLCLIDNIKNIYLSVHGTKVPKQNAIV